MHIKRSAQCLSHSKYSINSSCYDKDDSEYGGNDSGDDGGGDDSGDGTYSDDMMVVMRC